MTAYKAAQCRSCAGWVIWAETEAGKRIPVDAHAAEGGSLELRTRYGRSPLAVVIPAENRLGRSDLRMPHHATCPDGDQWRRK